MATGPEHYAKAEQLISEVRKAQASVTLTHDPQTVASILAEAQVHATLALAAATALSRNSDQPLDDREAWWETAATRS